MFARPIILLLALFTKAAAQPSDTTLLRYQKQNDLSDWIYTQIQWVAAAPAQRASQLQEATHKAWRAPRTEEEIQAWQDLLTNEGYMWLLNGAVVPSTDAYTAAYDWARAHPELADDHLVVDNILKPLGNNYTRLGDYGQAIFIHEQALTIALKENDPFVLAGVYSNLAGDCSDNGQPLQALAYCRRGLAVAGRTPSLRGLLLSEQADAFQALHRQAEAASSILEAIDLLKKASAIDWLLTAYQQAGDIFAGVPEKALSFYKEALALKKGNIREQAKLLQRLGALYLRLGLLRTADDYQQKALAVLRPGTTFSSLRPSDAYAEYTFEDLLYDRARWALASGQTDDALRLFGLSFATGTRLRQELVTGTSREQWAADARERFEQAISTAWTAWNQFPKPVYAQYILDFMESSKAQLLLEEIRHHQADDRRPPDSVTRRIRLLEGAIAYYNREAITESDSVRLGALSAARAAGWELARLRKAPDSSVLSGGVLWKDALGGGLVARSYFVGSKALYTVECTASAIDYVECLPGAWQDSLKSFTGRWFAGGAEAMINHPRRYGEEAYSIYHRLFGTHPLEPGKSYILLPDGSLDLLPVEALLTRPDFPEDPADWPFVIRQESICYNWSLETLRQQKLDRNQGKGFSGFFLPDAHGSSPVLNAIASEETGIRRFVPSGNWFTAGQATTAAFRHALSSSEIVHLSAHAYIQQDSLAAPHIALYDGPFYFFEASGHPALVVLSACKTGDGRAVTGEGVQSLSRAFTAGGARAVISGWWNVNDETAARLMIQYYEKLREPGGAAQALRASKLRWLDDPEVSSIQKLPYFWAALQYQGDPDALTGRSSHRLWWLGLLLIVAAGITWRLTRRP
ncbi:CHAT domain-containing protein [Dinghuibacter silviterrae]|uniref:CHAT domain-containing protein n=1 Tax=Dinghuibacter silviterrae TaxID=1539049 RepID=A0A4R8DK91_9BACT|nr:CHAT domain-containing tetratricopeptide repeat protein [Dinghuibacter silviterrae]TDW97430.1 CHAT domain-containing protein [Dinghuibacter silviterrae]